MRVHRIVLALALGVVLSGCGKKDDDTSGGGGSGGDGPRPTREIEPGVPAPPSGPVASGRAARIRSSNSLKQIGIALHAYNDINNHLPAGYYDKDGKPGLSWRVAILPLIEEDKLYKEFKLDEPWNSDHNKKLIARMPKVYAPPGDTDTRGYTFYRAFTGPDTVMQPQPMPAHLKNSPAPPSVGRPARTRLPIQAIPDGTVNTALVGEARDAVVWTKPDELVYDPKGPLPKLGGGVLDDGFHLVFADGAVRFIKLPVNEKMLRAVATAAGDEKIDSAWFE